MRRIDDGIMSATARVFEGELRVGCDGDQPIAPAWRVATAMVRDHPQLSIIVEDAPPPSDLEARLLRGEMDVAIVTVAPSGARLAVDRLGDVTYGIYCGKGHPLHARREPTLEAIRAHAFVAPTARDDADQWPKALERNIALRVPALEPAIAIRASGALLAVLPDVTVAAALASGTLRRLPSDMVPASALYCARRRETGGGVDRAAVFAAALVEEAHRALLGRSFTAPRGQRRSPAGQRRRTRR